MTAHVALQCWEGRLPAAGSSSWPDAMSRLTVYSSDTEPLWPGQCPNPKFLHYDETQITINKKTERVFATWTKNSVRPVELNGHYWIFPIFFSLFWPFSAGTDDVLIPSIILWTKCLHRIFILKIERNVFLWVEVRVLSLLYFFDPFPLSVWEQRQEKGRAVRRKTRTMLRWQLMRGSGSVVLDRTGVRKQACQHWPLQW